MTRAALAALLLAGCAPVVTHGPRVETGGFLTATAGSPIAACDTACEAPLSPTWGGTVRGGWAPADPRRPAVMGGVTVPVFTPSSAELDLYVQGPGRDAPLAYGAGVLVSRRHTVPYAQLGRTPPGGAGWYATLGYARLRRFDDFVLGGEGAIRPVPGVARPPRYWQPQVAARFPTRTGPVDVYLAGGFGSYLAEGGPRRRRVGLLAAGAVFALDARSLPRSNPAPRIPPFP